MRFLFIIPMVIFYSQASSQTIIARVIDKDLKNPVEYANIGIIGKNKGTVSDKDGWFSLELLSQYDIDTLRISCIGYETVSFTVGEIMKVFAESRNKLIIELNRKIPVLAEVTFAPRKMKRKIIGSKGKLFAVAFESSVDTALGQELGTFMKIKRSPAYIQDVNFVITSSNYDDSILCRINIYSMDDALPGDNILKEPILVSMKIRRGVFTVDLTRYNIYVDDDFVVSIEWIEQMGKKNISFGLGLKSKSYTRITSQADWERFPLRGFGIGIYTTVLYMD